MSYYYEEIRVWHVGENSVVISDEEGSNKKLIKDISKEQGKKSFLDFCRRNSSGENTGSKLLNFIEKEFLGRF